MPDPIIDVRKLSKRYQLGAIGPTSLREELGRLRDWFRAGRPASRSQGEFWALRDVSFTVPDGEVLGIIGRNGAGKSTLLKILSRITQQTGGEIVLRGRVASLLEVGTGFHPDLTGRENVFLNGAILGMTRAEIRRKFDAIVAFAEVDEFVDTPVKRYSSGMHVRLAFAVAAHLEPEILIVDEVLAVGDAAFQQKCVGKMSDVANREGRTVLFVSHNMAAVQSLCHRAILLEQGRITADGQTRHAIATYLSGIQQRSAMPVAERADRGGDGSVRIRALTVAPLDGSDLITSTSALRIRVEYESTRPLIEPRILVGIYAAHGVGIYGLDSDAVRGLPTNLAQCGVIECVTGPLNLTAGSCSLNIAFFNGGTMADYVTDAAMIAVEADDFHGTGKAPGRDWMIGLLHHRWHAEVEQHAHVPATR